MRRRLWPGAIKSSTQAWGERSCTCCVGRLDGFGAGAGQPDAAGAFARIKAKQVDIELAADLVEHVDRALHFRDAGDGGLERAENLLRGIDERVAIVAVIVNVALGAKLGHAVRDKLLALRRVGQALAGC